RRGKQLAYSLASHCSPVQARHCHHGNLGLYRPVEQLPLPAHLPQQREQICCCRRLALSTNRGHTRLGCCLPPARSPTYGRGVDGGAAMSHPLLPGTTLLYPGYCHHRHKGVTERGIDQQKAYFGASLLGCPF